MRRVSLLSSPLSNESGLSARRPAENRRVAAIVAYAFNDWAKGVLSFFMIDVLSNPFPDKISNLEDYLFCFS